MGIVCGRRQNYSRVSGKTQFTENSRKINMFLRMINARVVINLCTMKNWKRASSYQHMAHKTLFVSFLTPPPFLSQKSPHVVINILQEKSIQASDDTFFLMAKFKSLSISQNKIWTIKKRIIID